MAAATEDPLTEIRRLRPAFDLAFLFRLALCRLVRGGPNAGATTPRRLLQVAQAAAAAGIVPLAAPGDLRRMLEDLEAGLHAAEAWDPARPLWWSSLPAPGALEELWLAFRRPREPVLRFPSSAELAAAFSASAAPRWLALPALAAAAFVAPLHRELEAVFRSGELGLAREGVGATGEVSSRRSDEVRYLTGREPEVLAGLPRLAALVQWGLCHLAEQLGQALAVYPPQQAMLARYDAPSSGYGAHLDNPGGARDNGRTLTLVLYLNGPGDECAGGELALWAAGASTREAPVATLEARGGSAVLFDSCAIAHQVRPVADGPARWALIFWLNRAPQVPPSLGVGAQSVSPRLTLTDVLLPLAAPALPTGRVLFHELDDRRPAGEIVPRSVGRDPAGARPRSGIVATVYRAGADLDTWCEHHLARAATGLGADHLVLVFDHLEEAAEAAAAERLRAAYSRERLTIWSGAGLAAERWPSLRQIPDRDEVLRFAGSGASSYAVASRQMLNASVALAAARTGELGGEPLDWLIHLDADELLYLEGPGRGGATLGEHFAAASAAGLRLLRYVNHELLAPPSPGAAPRFKINPRLAAARLGPGGWSQLVAHLEMAQTDPRPYFHGYFNGKSAVAVDAAVAAAGVHSWALEPSCGPESRRFLAGPCVLHFHFPSSEAFRGKYLGLAGAAVPEGPRPFEPCPAEEAALGLIHSLRQEGADEETLGRRLDELHRRLTEFSERDVALLEEAGVILRPDLASAPPVGWALAHHAGRRPASEDGGLP